MATKSKSGTSKTAKAANRAGSASRATPAADIDRVVELGGGRYAYLYHPDGRAIRVVTGSPEFVAVITEINGLGHGARIRRQIEQLAATKPTSPWPGALAALLEAQAFGA